MRDRVREERAQDASANVAQLRELFGPPPVLSTENPKAGLCGSHLRRARFTEGLSSPASDGGACTGAREIGSTICDRLLGGETLSEICRDADMPDKPTVMRWLAQHPTFLDEYVFTWRLLAEDLAAARRRLRLAIRHWVAGRLIRKIVSRSETLNRKEAS